MANAQGIGISKRQLLEDYYFDEIGPLFDEWTVMHSLDDDNGDTEERMDPRAFFGLGGG